MTTAKHAATEVPAAETIQGCRQLVETAQKTQKYCVMLENCCYFREVMLVHNMLQKGLFGELRHCEAGYQHYGGRVRPAAATRPTEGKVHTANSYPTHPIGPVAQWMDINRGNRFDYLVSMSADGFPSVGHGTCPTRPFGGGSKSPTDGKAGNRSADINTSLIRTARAPDDHPLLRHQAATSLRSDLSGAGHWGHLDGHNGQDLHRGAQGRNPRPGSRWRLTTSSLSIPSGKLWGRKLSDAGGTGAATGWKYTV